MRTTTNNNNNNNNNNNDNNKKNKKKEKEQDNKNNNKNNKYFLLKWSGSQRGEGYVLNPKHKTKEELLEMEGVRAFTFVECDRIPKTWVVNFKTKEEVIAFISKRADIIEQRLNDNNKKK